MKVSVNRKHIKFLPDATRVIARFLYLDDERTKNTIRALLTMSENEASFALSQVLRDFSLRHRNISKVFSKHNDDLIIPYAMSDYASTYATVNLRELLNELKNSR
jgi:beta-1,2-mannobiose phosphorylase / 1,2-beta-oligomannan phosphorylase